MTQKLQNGSNYDVPKRISRLEKKVRELEARLALVEERRDPDAWQEAFFENQLRKTKKGPKPGMSAHDFFTRDWLVNMLEDYWPELALFVSQPSKPGNIHEILRRIAQPIHGKDAEMAKHLLDNFEKLIQFLSSDRFRSDPRQITNAMAGLPKVGWWRSLKVCAASPCEMAIGVRALPNYVCRRFPDIAKRLDTARDTIEVGLALRNVRTRDEELKNLKRRPDIAVMAWKAGKPDFSKLK